MTNKEADLKVDEILKNLNRYYPNYEWSLRETVVNDLEFVFWSLRAEHKRSWLCYMQTFTMEQAIAYVGNAKVEDFIYMIAKGIDYAFIGRLERGY